jgi:hypothetical protein
MFQRSMAASCRRRAGAPEGAIAKAAELAKQDGWHNPDQYKNKANPASHFKTTGPEIWKQASTAAAHGTRMLPCHPPTLHLHLRPAPSVRRACPQSALRNGAAAFTLSGFYGIWRS